MKKTMFHRKLKRTLPRFLRWWKLRSRQSFHPVVGKVGIGWEIGTGSLEGSRDFEEFQGWGSDTPPGSWGCLGRWAAERYLDSQEAQADLVGWRQGSETQFDSQVVGHLADQDVQV